MNLSAFSWLELAVAVICFAGWLWTITRKNYAEMSPGGGGTVIFLIGLGLGLAAFLDESPHTIVVIGFIILAAFGMLASGDLIGWLNSRSRGILAYLGGLIAIGAVATFGELDGWVTAVVFVTSFGLVCPFLYRWMDSERKE